MKKSCQAGDKVHGKGILIHFKKGSTQSDLIESEVILAEGTVTTFKPTVELSCEKLNHFSESKR